MSTDAFKTRVDTAFAEIDFRGEGIGLWSYEPWRRLVLTHDWVCPSWSSPAWTADEKYIWYSACHGKFEGYVEPPEIADVGLTLSRWGNAESELILEDIEALSATWSLCLFEPDDAGATVFDGELVFGTKDSVRFLERADYLLVIAQNTHTTGHAILSFKKDAADVFARVIPGLSGAYYGQVEFQGARPEAVVGHLPDNVALERLRFQSVGFTLGRSGALSRQLELVADEVARQGLDELLDRHTELSVEVLALQAMEERSVAESNSIPWALLHAKGTSLQLKVGELLVDTFGYYALPYPDEVTLHNEGVIGSEGSLRATRQMLGATEAVNYANLAGDLYDIAALDLGLAVPNPD